MPPIRQASRTGCAEAAFHDTIPSNATLSVDTSASMQALDEDKGKSRLDQALSVDTRYPAVLIAFAVRIRRELSQRCAPGDQTPKCVESLPSSMV